MLLARNTNLLGLFGIIVLVLAMLACSDGSNGNYNYRSVSIRTNPYNNETGVSPSIVIRAAFSHDIQPGTLDTNSFSVSGPAGNIAGSVQYDGQYKSASFTPSASLLHYTSYSVNLAGSIMDSRGYTIPGYWWTFTTGAGGWGTAELRETDNAGTATAPKIATDKNGNAMAVWQQSDGVRNNIWASYYSVGSGWGAAVKIETDDAFDATNPQLTMNAAGNVVAVWQQKETAASFINIWSNHYEPAVGWAGAEKIEFQDIGDATNPDVAIDPAGNAIAVWQSFDGSYETIYAVRYLAGTGWQTATNIDTNIGAANKPKIAMDGSGNAIAVWYQVISVYNSIQSSRYTSGGGWSVDATISSAAYDALDPQIAIDGNGNAHAIWYEFDGTRNNILANYYIAGGSWQTPTLVEYDNAGNAASPQIAIDATNNAMAVWVQSDGSLNNTWANQYIAGSGWSAAQTIETDNTGNAAAADVAFDSNGNAIAVWYQSDGARDNIYANIYSAGIGWGTAGLIETDNLGNAQFPQIIFDSNGKGHAIWQQSDGSRENIWINTYASP